MGCGQSRVTAATENAIETVTEGTTKIEILTDEKTEEAVRTENGENGHLTNGEAYIDSGTFWIDFIL